MKILLINSTEKRGGAAQVTYNLFQTLLKWKHDVHFLVQTKESSNTEIIGPGSFVEKVLSKSAMYLDMLPLLKYPKWKIEPFYSAIVPDLLLKTIQLLNPDIIHLHNITRGFLKLETLLTLETPIIYTMHDSWPFTGGCTVPYDCSRFLQNCGCCPVLGSRREYDLSNKNWKRKEETYTKKRITFVAPSKWLAHCAQQSSLLKDMDIEVVPNGINLDDYIPIDKDKARKELSISATKHILVFGANYFHRDKNKGFRFFHSALEIMPNEVKNSLHIILFGSNEKVKFAPGISFTQFGYIDNKLKTLIYSASDLTIFPSMVESFGLVPIESMASGTPVVAFATSAIVETISHMQTGYLAQPLDIDDLAKGILTLLRDRTLLKNMGINSMKRVKDNYSSVLMSEKYLDIYNRTLS
jgi:glycosyltransferase involved in cell wall biosynthesis